MPDKRPVDVRSYSGPEWPTVAALDVDGMTARIELKMQASLQWFEGHYPNMPLLPGVAQVHIAAMYGRAVFQLERDFSGMDAVKFSSVIKPDFDVTLDLDYSEERQRLNFRFSHDGVACSSGRIMFASES